MPFPCEAPACRATKLEECYIAPHPTTGAAIQVCGQHYHELWQVYRDSLRATYQPPASTVAILTKRRTGLLTQQKLSGVQVRYPGQKTPVPSVWTATRVYPYPNHRRKLGLKGSYDSSDCAVVSWGKHQKPKEAK